MIKFKFDDNLIRIALLTIFTFVLYNFILLPLGFLYPLGLNFNDALLNISKKTSRDLLKTDEIVVLKIDEETIAEVNKKWPWERSFFADILEKISVYNPKVIGLDITFSGTSQNIEEDKKFEEILRKLGNVILAGYITEKGDYIPPYPLFAKASYGHGFVNKITDIDYKVRTAKLLYTDSSLQKDYFSFEVVAAAAYFGIRPEQIFYKNNFIHIGDTLKIPLTKNGNIYIDYIPLNNFINIPLSSILNSKEEFQSSLENKLVPPYKEGLQKSLPKGATNSGLGISKSLDHKIVLLGTTSKALHDIYQTPEGMLPGVSINAAALNTILQKSFIVTIPTWIFLLVLFAILLLTSVTTYNFSFPKGMAVIATEIILLFITGIVLIKYGFKFDYFSSVFLVILCWFTANGYKYSTLLYFNNRLRSMVIKDAGTGLATARYFQFKLQLELAKIKNTKEEASIVVFCIPELQEISQKYPREQTGIILSQTGFILKQNSRKKVDLLSRWKDDKFSAILLKTDISEAVSYCQKIISKIEENEFVSQEGSVYLKIFAGVSNYPAVRTDAAESLISCAEAASTRAKLSGQKIVVFNPQQDKVQIELLKRKTLASETEYITVDIEEREKELLNALEELKKSQQEIQKAHFATILSLVKALEEKDSYTAGHSERVANYAIGIAKELKLSETEANLIRESALLHDIGKFGLSDLILHKKDTLTAEEIEQIRQHPLMGARILEKSKFFENHIPLIIHHHERFDGKGYPHGLSGKFIPRGAQIISIADALDAMTTGRGYNRVLSIKEAIEELKKAEGKQFDPEYTKAAITYLSGDSKS
jgi:diguanylate cyclase (GGDEF)-like protein/putative nucleotidyltransferase with HDIG domain